MFFRNHTPSDIERSATTISHSISSPSSYRSSPPRIYGPEGRKLQIHFKSRLPPHLFTGGKVEGGQGTIIGVVLLDANMGLVIPSGPESLAKLNVVILEGDFTNDTEVDWGKEHFESFQVKECKGKRPLLTGDLEGPLKEGVGTIGELNYIDNSSLIRSRKFRLDIKVARSFCDGLSVREAKAEAFTVKDHRGKCPRAGKLYLYLTNETQSSVVFNHICKLRGDIPAECGRNRIR